MRAYPLPIDYEATRGVARRPRVREFEERVLARRREYAILRVDRADLSKNVLRGFTAFDIFLEQHPEFAERITFTAQLMPSRTDVPEYAEYLEKIEALVAVVNHRHGTPDWMPIDLKLRDDLDEAVASYKHYDVMMVNAMFDGMNLVAKEGPLVNERHGVSILSENTGAHEELGEYAISRQPVRRPGARRRDLLGPDDVPGGPRAPRPRPEGDRHLARPGRLDRRADRGHPRQEQPALARALTALEAELSPVGRRRAARVPGGRTHGVCRPSPGARPASDRRGGRRALARARARAARSPRRRASPRGSRRRRGACPPPRRRPSASRAASRRGLAPARRSAPRRSAPVRARARRPLAALAGGFVAMRGRRVAGDQRRGTIGGQARRRGGVERRGDHADRRRPARRARTPRCPTAPAGEGRATCFL